MKRFSRFAVFLMVSLVLVSEFAVFRFVPDVMSQEEKVSSTVGNVGVAINWTEFWRLFHVYALWDLEWYDGSAWVSVKEDLQVIRNYPEENWCKITLNFTSSHAGSYRLTFAINKVVSDYVEKVDKYQYDLTYQNLTVTFDWSDCAGISGLTFTHGVKDGYFWFRIRRDNVPLGAHVTIDPSTVATSTTYYAVSSPCQRKGFYAAGRFWAFYSDGTNAVYESTTDPNDWTGTVTSIGACSVGIYFSVWFDGTYVHYARYNSANYYLYYRRGTPNSDGTITWSAAEQTVYEGTASLRYDRPCITVDNGGYAWIGVRRYSGGSYTPWVLKNANNNGTWATDFSYQLSTTSDAYWNIQPIALTSSKVYVIYCYSNALPYGKLYNGGWGSEESDLADYNIQNGYSFCAVAEGDNVHFAYSRYSTYQLRYNKRTYGTGWGTNDVLVVDSMESYSAPSLSINTANGNLYLFYTKISTDHVYYIKRVSGTWDSTPTDWIDESTDTIYYGYLHNIFAQAYSNYIGLLYITKSASPYNIKFAYLTLAAGQSYTVDLSQPITTSLSQASRLDFTLIVSQPTTFSFATVLNWNALLNIQSQPSVTLTQASKTDFTLTFSSSTSTSWSSSQKTNYTVKPSNPITATFTSPTQTDFNIQIANPSTYALTSLPQWNTKFETQNPITISLTEAGRADYKILMNNPTTTSINIPSLSWNAILNIPQAITNSFTTTLQSTFNLSPQTSISLSLAEAGKSDFTLTVDNSITTALTQTPIFDAKIAPQFQPSITLQNLPKTSFNLAFTNPISTSWTLDILLTHAAAYTVNLACSITSSFISVFQWTATAIINNPISTALSTISQSIFNVATTTSATVTVQKLSQTDFTLAIQTSTTPQFSFSSVWNSLLIEQFSPTVTCQSIGKSDFVLTIETAATPSLASTQQWNTALSTSNPITVTSALATKGDYALSISNPATLSLNIPALTWNAVLNTQLQPSITFENIPKTDFHIAINNPVTTNWVLNIIHTSIATYTVNLATSITMGFETVKQWFANIIITTQPTITLTLKPQSNFAIAISNLITNGFSLNLITPTGALPPGSWFPAKITLWPHIATVLADIWQWTWTMQVPVTANVTVVNESPYTSGTLHYQIVNLDTNTTVTDWTVGESVLIDTETNTTVTIQTTVPIQRNFEPEHFRAKVKLSLISQTIEAQTDFTVEKEAVRQFYGNVALLSLCACLVGVGVYSYRQKLEPWKKYPTLAEQKKKKYPERKG